MSSRRSFVASLVGAGLALPSFREDAIAQVRRAYDRAGTADAPGAGAWASYMRSGSAPGTPMG
jgi:hypothetical protein